MCLCNNSLSDRMSSQVASQVASHERGPQKRPRPNPTPAQGDANAPAPRRRAKRAHPKPVVANAKTKRTRTTASTGTNLLLLAGRHASRLTPTSEGTTSREHSKQPVDGPQGGWRKTFAKRMPSAMLKWWGLKRSAPLQRPMTLPLSTVCTRLRYVTQARVGFSALAIHGDG